MEKKEFKLFSNNANEIIQNLIFFRQSIDSIVGRGLLKKAKVGQELKKILGQKFVKSNKNQFHEFFFTEFHFCNFKNGQKSIFELEKRLKLPKM